MKLNIFDSGKKVTGSKELPNQFSEEFRPDLIKKAVQAIQSHKRQQYGSAPGAGMRASAELSRRRRAYRGSYGHGISRVPRKIMSRRGTRMNWVGAVAPGTVGGRKAHPPKSDKVWDKKINVQERRKAIRSAIAATLNIELVKGRGHFPPIDYPFIINTKLEDVDKTKDIIKTLETLGFKKELARTSEKKVRAGKGKLRGRKYRRKKGLLLVVSKDCKLSKAARNIQGFEIATVESLNAESLAPGTDAGRLTVFTDAAIERLAKENLFFNNKKLNISGISKKLNLTKKPKKEAEDKK